MTTATSPVESRPTNGQAVARVEKVTKVYSKPGTQIQVNALRGVSIEFQPGEFVAICGQSGSGKSTLMNILGCLDKPTSGSYFLGGKDVSKLDDNELSEFRGKHLGFVFQSFNLIPQLTVLENLEVPLFYQGVDPEVRRRKAQELIEMVELGDRGHHRPNELSGGQQQRVAIARSLINDPLILLADEPTGNLDTATGDVILSIFDRLNRQGKTILVVTHEPDVAARCKRTIILRDGNVILDDLNTPRN